MTRAEDWYRDASLSDASRLRFTISDLDQLDREFQAFVKAMTARMNWLVGGVFLLEATIIGALIAVALNN